MTNSWETPPEHLDVAPDEVHVWAVSLLPAEDLLKDFNNSLSSDEHARAERFKFPHLRRRFIASQGYLRHILGCYLQQPPHALEFQRTERGKPFLTIPQAHNVRFNVSHSHEMAVYGIMQTHELGIDVEYLRPMPDAEQIATRFFSAPEQASLLALPAEQRVPAFFRCWTRKEAFIKAIGEGLYYPLDQFSVSLTPNEPARLLTVADKPEEAACWTILKFVPAPGYIAALAVRSPVAHIRYWWIESLQGRSYKPSANVKQTSF